MRTKEAKTRYNAPCWRCGGAGQSDAWNQTGRVCYRCNGTGIDPKHSIEATKKHQVNEQKKQAQLELNALKAKIKEKERQEKAHAEYVAFMDAHPLLKEVTLEMEAKWYKNPYEQAAYSIWSRIKQGGYLGFLTDKQIGVIERAVTRYKNKHS